MKKTACAFAIVLSLLDPGVRAESPTGWAPGDRVLLDAHNAYPYEGRFADRVTRALAAGVPLAIEQDIAWCANAEGHFEAVVAHDTACRGDEPTLQRYFFDQVAPLLDRAVSNPRPDQWPLVTLNLDFKMEPPDLLRAVWTLLARHPGWLTTAVRNPDDTRPSALTVGPLLVLTGESDAQERVFHDAVPPGSQLLVFGAAHNQPGGAEGAVPSPMPATNYRRWWNHPWKVVEPKGQREAGAWTADAESRLQTAVSRAHAAGLWIRFYTLDGFPEPEGEAQGWFASYNFGSRDAVDARWRAAISARVDFIATDQYEALRALLDRRDSTR
jgi:hypothetical protein